MIMSASSNNKQTNSMVCVNQQGISTLSPRKRVSEVQESEEGYSKNARMWRVKMTLYLVLKQTLIWSQGQQINEIVSKYEPLWTEY